MSDDLRKWKLVIKCYAQDGLVTTHEHDIESTGTPAPQTNSGFLMWSGPGTLISYNSVNVYSWTMEEIHSHD